MAISIDWQTGIFTVPQADLTLVSGTLYNADTNAIRLEIYEILSSEEGIPFATATDHSGERVVAGITYARSISMINGYQIEFEDGLYSVILQGSNNDLWDIEAGILVQNSVQVIPTNSAGLQTVTTGSGLSAEQAQQMLEVWRDMGLDPNNPLSIDEDGSRESTDIAVDAVTTGTTPNRTTTLTRQ